MGFGVTLVVAIAIVWWGVKLGREAAAATAGGQAAAGSPAQGGRPRGALAGDGARDPAPSGSRGVYLVDDGLVRDLRIAGALVTPRAAGVCAVEWRRPGVILGRGTEELEEILTAPDGSVWRAVPLVDCDAPWWLERAEGWEPREADQIELRRTS